MKKFFLMISVFLGLMAFVLPAQATTLNFSLGTSFPGSDKPDPDGDGPWLNALFDDKGSAGSVFLTLSANLTGTNKVGLWYFNLDTNYDPTLLSFAVQGTPYEATAPEADKINTGRIKADGDGYYDIEFVFPQSNPGPFDNHESITYLITSTQSGLLASSFDFLSEPGGGEGIYKTAAHIQSITAPEGSTWIGDGGVPVPEPATMLLLGFGLIGLAGVGRKKFLKS